MKKNLFATIILCMMATLSTKAQVYALDDAAERKANCEYVFTGPPSQLTFEAKKQWASIGGLKFEQYVNGSWIGSTDVSSLGTSYKNYGPFQLDKKATKIRFVKNGTLDRYIRNVKVTMASYLESNTTSLTMPSTEIGTATTASFSISHSNIAQLTVSSNNNSVFTPNITTITESGEGKYGTSTITITYNPNAVGTQEGIITIGNGTQQIQIAVQGSATKKQQQISWQDNIDIIPENYLIENAAQASSGLEVSYESDNEAVIIVENNHLRAVGVGTAIITATQAGDDTWEAASSTKEIEVTALEIQTITWEQDFLRLKLGDAPITLNATTSSGEAINYVSGDNTIILVDGNQLTIVGTGTTTLTAQQVGNTIYAPASLTKVVRPRQLQFRGLWFQNIHPSTSRRFTDIQPLYTRQCNRRNESNRIFA